MAAISPHSVGPQGSNSVLGNVMNGINSSGGGFFKGLGNFMGSSGFTGAMDLGSLALNAYGLNKSLGFAEDQLGILKDQEDRAATAQNLGTNNSLSLALQTTTPGSAEHEQIKQAIAQGQYQV